MASDLVLNTEQKTVCLVTDEDIEIPVSILVVARSRVTDIFSSQSDGTRRYLTEFLIDGDEISEDSYKRAFFIYMPHSTVKFMKEIPLTFQRN